jgi:hypothetical protein
VLLLTQESALTLVVARVFSEKIVVYADTKVSDPTNTRRSPLRGVLKVIILNPHLAVAYAGVVDYAEAAIKSLLYIESMPVEHVLSVLREASEASNRQVDFIVASLQGGPALYKVSDGEISRNLSSAWLGNHAAFELYQQGYASTPEATDVPHRMREAFERVLSSGRIDDVGGFPICVHIHPHLALPMFVYHVSLSFHNPEEFSVGNAWTTMPLGTVEGGAFCLSQLRTLNLMRHGVALHFFPGNFGVLFCPQISFAPLHFKDVTASYMLALPRRDGHADLK